MNTDPRTRFSQALPPLHFSLSLLYVGRLLIGMGSSESTSPDMTTVDEYIEAVTDELRSTELLHQAAVLAGDVLTGDALAGDVPAGDILPEPPSIDPV